MPKYVPEPVPQSDNIQELQRYIDVELRRISDAVNVKVDGAYGGLFQSGAPATIVGLDPVTWELFNPYTTDIPETPDGVQPDLASGSLVILTPGNYIIAFTTTIIDILPNEEWEFNLALNGAATGLGGVVAPSNQTEIYTVSFNIIFNASKGDVLTIVVRSATSLDVTVAGSEFMANRVSEEF